MGNLFFLSLLTFCSATGAPAFLPELNAALQAQMPLEQGWQSPPQLARIRVWWWLNGNTDKETITRDLEAMKANGIGGANIIDAGGDNQQGNPEEFRRLRGYDITPMLPVQRWVCQRPIWCPMDSAGPA